MVQARGGRAHSDNSGASSQSAVKKIAPYNDGISKPRSKDKKNGASLLNVLLIIIMWYGTSCLATTGTKVIMKMKILQKLKQMSVF